MANLKNTTIDDTGFLELPIGTTAERPSNPELGMIRYNTDNVSVEFYDGTNWIKLIDTSLDLQEGLHLYRASSSESDTDYYIFNNKYGVTVTFQGNYSFFTSDSECLTTNPDGTKLYGIRSDDNVVNQYSLSIPFDIVNSTINFQGSGNLISGTNQRFQQPTFNSTGTKLYVNGGHGTNSISATLYEYNLSTPFDVKTISISQSTNPNGSWVGGMGCVAWNKDGTRFYLGSRGNGATISQYNLSISFDIGSVSSVQTAQTVDDDPLCIQLSKDGEYMFVLHHSPNMLVRYDLSTPFDITTLNNRIQIMNNENNDGMYISGQPQYSSSP